MRPATAASRSWRLADRLQGRLGLAGVFSNATPRASWEAWSARDSADLLLPATHLPDLLQQYFRDPAAANQALESF